MPNLEELKEIQDELRAIGNEPDTRIGWGERYVDLPLPETVDIGDENIDELLNLIDDNAVNSDADKAVNENQFSPESFAGLGSFSDGENFDDVISNFDFEEPPQADNAESGKSILDDFTDDDSIPDFSMPDLSNLSDDEAGNAVNITPDGGVSESSAVDEDFSEGVSNAEFDNLLSGLDFDTAPAGGDFDSDAPDLPEGFLDENFAESDEPSVTEVKPSGDESDDGLNTESGRDFEDVSLGDFDLSDVSFPDEDDASLAESTRAGSDELDLGVADDMEGLDDISEAISTDKEDEWKDLDFLSGANIGDLVPSENKLSASTDSIKNNATEFEKADSDFKNINDFSDDESEEDPYTPVEDISGLKLDIPSEDSIDMENLDADASAGVFPIPKDFETFSDTKDFKVFEVEDTKFGGNTAEYIGKIPMSISQADFDYFLERLETFPLNIRKEIQNYIANDSDLDVNKMELVHLIVKNGSMRKVVHYLEKVLKKSIKIPKGFEAKSVLEREREKKTFKYRLMHRYIPIASIATIIVVLLASVGVLAHQFIYKPIVAENFYKDGLFYIENGKYNTAIQRFDTAGTYWKKKRWYFKYADELRKAKQYTSAEAIYLRLLYDFNHDVDGGVVYSEMLSKELRNYEKAVTVLRRQVLDFHPNNPKAMVSLGNVYLDWGDELPIKYEEAGKIFSQLLLDDPANNLYNAGIMKYYIRTDNLEKVLPLKDFFLRRGAKIAENDLTELGTYLLEKRYEPKPADSETLRAAIDDLREVLERSYKMNPENPDANYNLGRFFIYNYKDKDAEFYLTNAVKYYNKEALLAPRRFVKKLDAMRLYAEILLKQGKDLEAESVLSNALSFYREYTLMREIPSHHIIGKLFEDYGDIKYFIANDYELALDAYTNSVRELNDTASIRYKIGFIYYKLKNYSASVTELSLAYTEKPDDKNLLYALGNALFKRGDYYSSQAYYERLMENLEGERLRKGILLPQIRADHGEFVQQYMYTANNLGVVLDRLAIQTGDSQKNARSGVLFTESKRAFDALTRNPETMVRVQHLKSLADLNIHYKTVPDRNFVPEIYSEIPKIMEHDNVLKQSQDK